MPRHLIGHLQTSRINRAVELLDNIDALDIPGVDMDVLSMGMANAYRVAIEAGSAMIRPGTVLLNESEVTAFE